PIFRALRDPVVFGRVAVDEYGETVTWPNGADLDPEVLYGSEKPAGRGPRVTTPQRV
nr:DUF2442 domain-containing protein [Rubrobacter sp.]